MNFYMMLPLALYAVSVVFVSSDLSHKGDILHRTCQCPVMSLNNVHLHWSNACQGPIKLAAVDDVCRPLSRFALEQRDPLLFEEACQKPDPGYQ